MNSISIKNLSHLEPELIKFRHNLHKNPELGFKEIRTSKKIADELEKISIKVFRNIGNLGVVGELKRGNSKKSILLRADMDALPIQEKSLHKYSSKNPGVMHACGHDGHSTMLLGCAKFLSENDCFNGTVYFLFQPNEEQGLGAKAMLDEGLLEKFPADEVYSIHNLPGEPLGEFSTRPGNICASETLFEISINGQGSHASMPNKGVDTILVGSELVLSLQSIVSRKLNPNSGAVFSVTEFITDGSRNILPGNTTLKGDFRTHNPRDRKEIEKFVHQICKGVETSHQVEIKVKIWTEFIETINSALQCEFAMKTAKNMGLKTNSNRSVMSFSEDFAHFTASAPGCFILMGNGIKGPHSKPLHSNNYDFNDKGLIIGAAFWANLVSNQLSKNK